MSQKLTATNLILTSVAGHSDPEILNSLGSILHELTGDTPFTWGYNPDLHPLDETDHATILTLDAIGMWSSENGEPWLGSAMGWDDDYEYVVARISSLVEAGDIVARRV
jgi:hypothetical protein